MLLLLHDFSKAYDNNFTAGRAVQEDPYYSELVDHYKDFEPRLDDMDTKPVSIKYK